MSKYTTHVRTICEFYAGKHEEQDYWDFNDVTLKLLTDYNNPDQLIDKAIPRIFESDIELFDPEYKNVLFHKILRHYYMREIGMETVALWKFYLNTTLKEILPYYNQLYKSELIKFDPMHDTDMDTTKEGTNRGNIGVTGSGSSSGKRNVNGQDTENITRNTHGKEDTSAESKEKTTVDDTAHNEASGTSETHNNGKYDVDRSHLDLYADTPQSGIQGLLGYNRLDGETANDVKFLTNARKITENEGQTHSDDTTGKTSDTQDYTDKQVSDGSRTDTGNRTHEEHEGITNKMVNEQIESNSNENQSKSDTVTSSTEQYVLHVAGKSAGVSYSKMLEEFRNTFLNIDMMIIRDLEPCFMQLW